MDKAKPWYQSNGVIASLLQMAAGVAIAMGWVNDAAGEIIIAEGPGLLVGLVNGFLGLWSFIGRVRATKEIAPAL